MNENQLQRLREYIDNHQNARRDATWAALCEAFGTHGFATSEDETPNEARRWSAVACGSGRYGVRDQFEVWHTDRFGIRWIGELSAAKAKARELNRQALDV